MLLLLLLLFIPGKNPMGLYGKLLCYVCLKESFREETCAFFAFQLRYTCSRIYNTVQASFIPYTNIHNARNCSYML